MRNADRRLSHGPENRLRKRRQPGLAARSQLLRLRRGLGPDVRVLAGGRAAINYAESLRAIDACIVRDLGHLRSELASALAAPGSPAAPA